MSTRRSRTWCQRSAAGALLFLFACSGEPSSPVEPADLDEPGSVAGELAVYIANFDDGTSETRYFLRDASGTERRLFFGQEPDVAPGARIKVWGTSTNDGLQVAKFKASFESRADGIGSQSDPLIGVPPAPPRILCPVLVTVNGGTVPANLGVPQIETQFHTGATSVNAYFKENSYGRNSIGGKTYGPFNYDMSTCDTSGMASTIRPMIPAADGCQQYAFVMVPRQTSCGWGGLGQVGTSDRPARDTWYNGSLSCVVTVQEPGHNFGGQHSSSITCSGAPASMGGITDTLAGCTHSEYGDRFDTMGGGCRHFNAWQKLYQKWWGGCNAVRVNSTATFNLYPTEIPCNGVQALQIPFPGGKTRSFQSTTLTSWYIEYRTSTGFDQGMTPQVLVHMGGAPVLPNQANPRGLHTWIVNASGNATNPGLTAGGSFSDPAGGVSVSVMSMDATKAVVQVTISGGSGSSVCLDGMNTPFTAPGPTDCTSIPPRPDGGATTGGGGSAGAGGTGGSGGAGGSSGGAGGGGGRDAGSAGQGGAGGAGGIRDAGRDNTGSGGAAGSGQGGTGQGGAGGQAGSTTAAGGNGPGGATGTGGNGTAGTSTGSGTAGSGTAGSGTAGSGSGGSSNAGGAGGSATAGRSGSGTAGKGGSGDPEGCACRIEAHAGSTNGGIGASLWALALGGLVEARRRRRRARAHEGASSK